MPSSTPRCVPGHVPSKRDLDGRYAVNDPALFLYDAAEVPSGVIFNLEPDGLSKYTEIDVAPEG